jgi:hypothetical protein
MHQLELIAGLFLSMMVLFGFSALSFTILNAALFMLTAGAAFIIAFYFYNAIRTALGMSMSLLLVGYAFTCIGFAIWLLFFRKNEEQ